MSLGSEFAALATELVDEFGSLATWRRPVTTRDAAAGTVTQGTPIEHQVVVAVVKPDTRNLLPADLIQVTDLAVLVDAARFPFAAVAPATAGEPQVGDIVFLEAGRPMNVLGIVRVLGPGGVAAAAVPTHFVVALGGGS